ncbi:uncharacterized protein EURHEDRAFT_409453 [Aspergillus ruber CBS 135680]|uniref:Uncharacterized protein n=1 Tax=Aspergillus ruber (strain CBS 135680) TaxID=1388766 RepID=A0A017SMX2_ASPRC|nr:uncharacterized protein EURHEDRAFT_409453 [Aspergillus ruber CBS 135680]EYE98136.1 hypothetical protein EURHEDRAFT_409453 [Aspergillus ruber CBS 135680]
MTEIDPRQSVDPLQTPKPLKRPLPNAAQIPLRTFQLPNFPPEAAHLKELTLTSDIKQSEYSDLLASTASSDAISKSIPEGIESLTLELFSLGYPASFLTNLAQSLPNLKALTLYSHLIDGISDASRKDAGEFIFNTLVGNGNNGGGLRELHLLDAFCRKGFYAGVGETLEDLYLDGEAASAMLLLEVSYTYRGHSDPGFLSRVHGDEIPLMLVPSLIAVSLRLSPPPLDQAASGFSNGLPYDPADVDAEGNPIPGQKPQGIIPFPSTHPGTALLVEKLTPTLETPEGETEGPPIPGPQALKMLDSTLYTLTLDELSRILGHQTHLAVLNASVIVGKNEPAKKSILNTIRSASPALETVELVGVPEEFIGVSSTSRNTIGDRTDNDQESSLSAFHEVFPTAADMASLSETLPQLDSFSMNILCAPKFGAVSWNKQPGGEWTGGFVADGQV